MGHLAYIVIFVLVIYLRWISVYEERVPRLLSRLVVTYSIMVCFLL
jgi:hypothetical protein